MFFLSICDVTHKLLTSLKVTAWCSSLLLIFKNLNMVTLDDYKPPPPKNAPFPLKFSRKIQPFCAK